MSAFKHHSLKKSAFEEQTLEKSASGEQNMGYSKRKNQDDTDRSLFIFEHTLSCGDLSSSFFIESAGIK